MIERVVLVCGILALLVLGAAQAYTSEGLLDELGSVPDINVTQVNDTTYMVLGASQESEADDLLNRLGERPDVNVTRVNETACLVILQPTETTIALCAQNNRYVREDNENLYVDSVDIGGPERFRLVERGDCKVSFIAPNGRYVGFYSGTNVYEPVWSESRYPTALFDEKSESTIFEKIYKGDGRYAFKAYNGGYLKVEADGHSTPALMADFSGSYDTFQIEIQEPIQKAIDAINPGDTDTIYLKEGIYRQTVNIDRSVTILGADSGETFVDGDKKGPVFTIGKDVDVGLSTFTIRGGSSDFGAGINNFGRLKLFDMAITGSDASNSGGAIFNHGHMVCGVLGIHGCNADLGAGIFNDVGSYLDLGGANITYNTATTRGGGVLNKGIMINRGGIVNWNDPDNIVDETALQSAGDLASPAVDSCRTVFDWLCPGPTCNNRECSTCTSNWDCWSPVERTCARWQHICCKNKANKAPDKKHPGCTLVSCP